MKPLDEATFKRPERMQQTNHRNLRIERWARALAKQVEAVVRQYPDADPVDVSTLISLQSSPFERLNRSLLRGRGFAAFRK